MPCLSLPDKLSLPGRGEDRRRKSLLPTHNSSTHTDVGSAGHNDCQHFRSCATGHHAGGDGCRCPVAYDSDHGRSRGHLRDRKGSGDTFSDARSPHALRVEPSCLHLPVPDHHARAGAFDQCSASARQRRTRPALDLSGGGYPERCTDYLRGTRTRSRASLCVDPESLVRRSIHP